MKNVLNLSEIKENSVAQEFFREQQRKIYRDTSRLFAILMPLQWLASVIIAWFVAPLTWKGADSEIHPHIWAALFIGGAITLLPVFLALKYPEEKLTRYTVAVGQMLMSALLIHLTGGRIETHFHIFGSLAFLSFYRDWRVLVPATIIIAIDHIFRGWFYPQSIYGILTGGEWRWIEHAAWVIFEDIFLIASCRYSVNEMRQIAVNSAALNESEARYRAVVEQTTEGIVLIEPESLAVIECNEAFSRLLGCESIAEAKTLTGYDFSTATREEIDQLTKMVAEQKAIVKGERTYRRRDGSIIPVDISVNFITYNGNYAFCLNVKDITERKQAQTELTRLAMVAKKTQNCVIVGNSEGTIEWVNEGFTRLTGYEMSEVIGKNPLNFLVGEKTNQKTLQELIDKISIKEPFEGELYNYKKNGNGYWISISVMPLTNNEGELEGFISIETDITDRKAMEEDLQRAQTELEQRVAERTAELVCANEAMQVEVNERKRVEANLSEAKMFLHTVINNVPSLIFVKDIKGNFALVNQALADIFGTTIEDLTGKTDADFSHNPEEAQKFTEDDIKALQNLEDRFILEEKHTDIDGNVHWYQTSKRSVVLGNNESRYLVGVATDITERKHAEVELGEAQQFLRSVIDNIPNLIFVKDPKGRFTLANQAIAKMYGTAVKDLLGKTEADFNRPLDEVEKIVNTERKIVEDWEQILNQEEKLTDCKGNVHWMQTVKRPMFGDEGVQYILGIATDLTDRKVLEGQLRHAQKLESIGQLAAGIAHEINTPTQYVSDNTRFIRDAFTDVNTVLEKYDELLEAAREGAINADLISKIEEEIEQADLKYLIGEIPKAIHQSLEGVSRIADIVQSMKDFAHPGSGDKKMADINKAIESTITVARNEWKYVAEMETNFDRTLPPVPCLLGEFNQVILNMVINASHAISDVVGDASQGKGKITVSTTRVNEDWAEIRITDTGSGISSEDKNRIFDPFFTTKEVGKGTGQGLAISHTVIVDKHKGKLNFETEAGKGTTFIIQLPLDDNNSNTNRGNV